MFHNANTPPVDGDVLASALILAQATPAAPSPGPIAEIEGPSYSYSPHALVHDADIASSTASTTAASSKAP
jgi:hypothetical protein